MPMVWTLRPHGVDKLIMHVLLGIVDDLLNVARDVVDELPKSDSVVYGKVIVTSSDRCVQVVNKFADDLFLVSISNRHLQ